MTQGRVSQRPTSIVPCPTCHAPIGTNCKRPNGYSVTAHAARIKLLQEKLFEDKKVGRYVE